MFRNNLHTCQARGAYGQQTFHKKIAVSFAVMAFLLNAILQQAWAETLSPEGSYRPGPQREITKGVFLIADPRLLDPNFRKTVVLVIDHGSDGTLGVIVNRPTNTPVAKLLPDIREFRAQMARLYIGGPVYQQILLWLLRSRTPIDSTNQVMDDIYFSQDMNLLADVLKKSGPKTGFRVYAGYAGWGAGQLQAEFERGDWRILRAGSGLLFQKDPEKLWDEMIQRSSEQLIKGPSKTVPARFIP